MPDFVEPELARIVEQPAGGPLWVHEIKFDGYRMQLRVQNKRARAAHPQGTGLVTRFPEIIADARALPDCIS